MNTIRDEIEYRINNDILFFGGRLPEANAFAWGGYLAALLEWDLIDVGSYDQLWSLLPEIDYTPIQAILLGREP